MRSLAGYMNCVPSFDYVVRYASLSRLSREMTISCLQVADRVDIEIENTLITPLAILWNIHSSASQYAIPLFLMVYVQRDTVTTCFFSLYYHANSLLHTTRAIDIEFASGGYSCARGTGFTNGSTPREPGIRYTAPFF